MDVLRGVVCWRIVWVYVLCVQLARRVKPPWRTAGWAQNRHAASWWTWGQACWRTTLVRWAGDHPAVSVCVSIHVFLPTIYQRLWLFDDGDGCLCLGNCPLASHTSNLVSICYIFLHMQSTSLPPEMTSGRALRTPTPPWWTQGLACCCSLPLRWWGDT